MDITQLVFSVERCYLMKAQDKYILIDTGYAFEWEDFRTKLKDAGIGFQDISHIILTHHHDDHCGMLNDIIRENTDIRVVMSNLAPTLLQKGENDRSHGGGLVNKRIHYLFMLEELLSKMGIRKKRRTLSFPPYIARPNDILVAKDTRLEDIGIGLNGEIIATPGHSIDSICVIFDGGDCMVGDAAANMLKPFGTKNCVIFIQDMDLYYESWRKIIGKKAVRIFPSHGEPFSVEDLKKNLGKNKARNMAIS